MKNFLPRTISVLFLLQCCFLSSFSENLFSGGSGTSGTPYQISTLEDLEELASLVNAGTSFAGKYLVLTNNIDASATFAENYNTNYTPLCNNTCENIGFLSIGRTTPFSGNFNGQGFTIDSLMSQHKDWGYIGLFANIKNATISNLNVTHCLFGAEMIGGMVAKAENSTITNCFVEGTTDGYNGHGLIAGHIINTIITNCAAKGTFSASSNTEESGGIATRVENCTIYNCFSETNQSLIGYIADDESKDATTITNSIALPDNPNWSSRLVNSVSEGTTPIITTSFFYKVDASIDDNFGVGKQYELADKALFQNWDFDTVWKMDHMPHLMHPNRTFSGGTGTSADPYLISSLDDLDALAILVNRGIEFKDVYFKQSTDIDAAYTANKNYKNGTGFYPIGRAYGKAFRGNYDGNGKRILNLTIDREGINNIGLFGYTYHGCTVKKLGIENCDILGTNNVGGLYGTNYGAETDACFVTGSVSGGQYVGGFVGNFNSPAIRNCYSICDVNAGTNFGGGFIGAAGGGNVYNSYTASFVYGNGQDMGGFAGKDLDALMLSKCYFDKTTSGTGDVGIIMSEWSAPQDVKGLLVHEFQVAKNLEGFEFGDNKDKPWVINTDGHPYLYWEIAFRDTPTETGSNTTITTIYPNPSKEMIYISGIELSTPVKVYSTQGSLLIDEDYSSGINVSKLTPGVYFVCYNDVSEKLIIE